MAAGLLAPSAGTVEIFGDPLCGSQPRAGYLFQQDALMPWKTALDNVAVALEPKGVPRARGATSGRATGSRRVGLRAFVDRYPHMLSGGQRKRVALAQMLIRDPEILLMDEPFGPLDAQTRQIMGNLLLDLWVARPQGGDVRHARSRRGDRAVRPGRRHVGRAGCRRSSAIIRSTLPRPRDIAEIRLETAFHEIHREIWSSLRVEVQKAYAHGRRTELVRRRIEPRQAPAAAGAGRRSSSC